MRLINSKLSMALVICFSSSGLLAQESSFKVEKKRRPNSASEKAPSPKGEEVVSPEGIVVDDSNFKAIFNQSVAEEDVVLENKSRFLDAELAASYTSVKDLSLSNNYYTVNYGDELKAVPSVKFSLAKDIWEGSSTAVSGLLNLGYGFKQARILAESKRGTKLSDQVTLQWIPVSLGAQIKQKIPGTRRFSAFVSPSAGSQYFRQAGNLDGINQGYWIGFWNLRAGFVLFEPTNKKMEATFAGVVLGANISQALGSKYKFSSWSADLGVKFAL